MSDSPIRDDYAPWEWLASCLTQDGEGYVLQSPAGGRLKITNSQRRRIVACVNALAGVPTETLETVGKAIGNLIDGLLNVPVIVKAVKQEDATLAHVLECWLNSVKSSP